jgi:DNA-binding transcriptional ArsR family regulator
MVQYLKGDAGSAERAFAALADPARMAILDRLGEGAASISDLAEPAGMSLTGMKKHIRILEEAGLVTTEKRGRTRWCELSTRGFDEAAFWLDEFRRRQHQKLNRLEEAIEKRKREKEQEK